jgi:anti-sigma regulatory factor (Ser/Thr protein kinase)
VVLLPCVPSSVAVARSRISADLRSAGLFAATVADAALVLSELLSNAILHARPLPGARIRAAWVLTPATLEVLVSDGGSATRPQAGRPSLSALGGRGLSIVEHLCSSWGVRADDGGTTVWAVLPAPQPDRAAVAAGTVRGTSGKDAGRMRNQHSKR